MSEGNGDKLKAWGDRASQIRAIWQAFVGVVVVTGAAVLTYASLAGDVSKAKGLSEQNEKAIEKLTENVNTLSAGQALLNQAVTNDRNNNADFRVRTDDALKSIIQKLDRAERRDNRSDGR